MDIHYKNRNLGLQYLLDFTFKSILEHSAIITPLVGH